MRNCVKLCKKNPSHLSKVAQNLHKVCAKFFAKNASRYSKTLLRAALFSSSRTCAYLCVVFILLWPRISLVILKLFVFLNIHVAAVWRSVLKFVYGRVSSFNSFEKDLFVFLL